MYLEMISSISLQMYENLSLYENLLLIKSGINISLFKKTLQ